MGRALRGAGVMDDWDGRKSRAIGARRSAGQGCPVHEGEGISLPAAYGRREYVGSTDPD
jgi:hypothetical protein